ncbi:hypothetical protein BJP50_07245 [Paenibacillus odorifer]|nr:hypothetical protein BJP50_07245 [Paenibacillus odorifer]
MDVTEEDIPVQRITQSAHFVVVLDISKFLRRHSHDTDKGFRQVDFWEPTTCQSDSSEVQAKAIEANKLIYLNALLSLVSPGEDIQFGLGGSMEVVGYNIDGTSAMLTASPRERAEAAYVTIQVEK